MDPRGALGGKTGLGLYGEYFKGFEETEEQLSKPEGVTELEGGELLGVMRSSESDWTVLGLGDNGG